MRNMNNVNNVVYWYKNQLIITYYSTIDINSEERVFLQAAQDYENQVNQHILNGTPYTLKRTGNTNMALVGSNGGSNLGGISIFPAPNIPVGARVPPAVLAIFYTITIDGGGMAATRHMATTPGAGGMSNGTVQDHTLTVITHLHKHAAVNKTPFDAMPHWFWSGTDEVVHGCPTSPPIPVPDKGVSGMWKMNFTQLADTTVQGKTGEGVAVFVLDTLPPLQQLTSMDQVGEKNALLKMMTQGMMSEQPFNAKAPAVNFNYCDVPDEQKTARTGKDVYGRLVGFPIPDHGLSIAGIIRDLAPAAHIECIRILNDYAVGDTQILYQALDYIQRRIVSGQDPNLSRNPIIINLSLVVAPPENDWHRFGWDKHPEQLQRLLRGLATRMESMAHLGVLFVASAGNDSDPRDTMMNPLEVRFGPRYPAAFLYETPSVFAGPVVTSMIPVGALTQQGQPTIYSNHPGSDGIGACGGDLPQPKPWIPSAMAHLNAQVDTTQMDAICGVFSSRVYPALSAHDHYPPLSPNVAAAPMPDYPQYQIPQPNSWVFWAGTSFATPVISALAALVLQGHTRIPENEPGHFDVRKAIVAMAQNVTWTDTDKKGDMLGRAILIKQEWIDEK